MKEKSNSYESDIRELEEILSRIESGDLDVDVLTEEVKKASKLIKKCKEKLYKADEEIKKILDKIEE